MRIKSRAWASIAFSVLTSMVIAVLIASVLGDIRRDLSRSVQFTEVINASSAMSILANEFAERPTDRVANQSRLVGESLRRMLESISPLDARERFLLAQINGNYRDLQVLLGQFFDDENMERAAASQEAERLVVLATQLRVKARAITDDTIRLAVLNHERITAAQNRAITLVLALVGLVILLNPIVFYASNSSIVRRILAINDATRRITGGDLTHRIEEKGKDELGELAASFNKMTESLAVSHAILRKNQEELAHQVESRTRELKSALERAEAANRSKRDFLANMSHEIRTPMNGVLGMTELALQEDIPERAREFLQMTKLSGQNLLMIINDILDLSKIEAGKVELERQPFDLREAVESAIKPLKLNAEKKGLELLYSFDPEITGLVEGDSGRLRQVLTNIVGNAVKFTEQGRVAVSVNLAQAPVPGSLHVLFMVKDDGIGIPPDKLTSMFEPFAQVGGSAHAKYGGTGLGLSIARDLVGLMGGSIWGESEPGRGSTFCFTVVFALPRQDSESNQPAGDQQQERDQMQKLKILLAEDNLINRIFAVEILQKRGHHVEAVENGIETLERLRREKFDVVLMDIRMPEMGGEETARRIRSGEAGDPAVPIVALTAHALKGDRNRFLAEGMDDYLAKPIDLEEMDRVLEKILAKRNGKDVPVLH